MRRSSGQSVAPGITASDHSHSRRQSSRGSPSRSQITWSGKGTATVSTNSVVVPGAMLSISSVTARRTMGSKARVSDGLKAGCTIAR